MESHHQGHRSKHHHRDRHHRHHHRHRRSSENQPEATTPPPAIPPAPPQPVNPVKERNFKLLVDPFITKGAPKKVYRFDGIVLNEPTWSVKNVKDPRPMIPRRWARPEIIDLPVPRFKIDKNYVGEPPLLEITITNLNDNIDKAFLTDLVAKHGDLEEVSIFYHPVTRKHTGVARVVFVQVASAASCVAALHNRSVMGKSLIAFHDPLGKEWTKIIQRITNPEKEETKTVGEPPPPIDAKVETKIPERKMLEDAPSTSKSEVTPQTFNIPPPVFNRAPPTNWPRQREWVEDTQWTPPVPPTKWAPFASPPTQPPPPETQSALDLDTRIELLLKGGINGIAPPFLSLDEEKEPVVKPRSRSRSESSDEPLPPGVDVSPSLSPTAPVPSTCEYSSDKYLPLSTPPSPFLSEEEYLECLLKWRLKHLMFVQQEEDDERRKKQLADKVSEISSEDDDVAFAKADDKMSLSSLSSVNENIEDVPVPLNPYGTYHGEMASYYPQPSTSSAMWPYYPTMYPPLPSEPSEDAKPVPPPEDPSEMLNQTVDLALDRVCDIMIETLERDLMKKVTEVIAFNEFEKWWEAEEKKYYEKEPEKEKKENAKEEVPEEKMSTTDALLNAIVDSNLDSGFSLGFRATLPKLPSFKRKQPVQTPGPQSRFDKRKEKNESDEEEMVKVSDSESDEGESVAVTKKRLGSDISSESLSSESSDYSSSDESVPDKMEASKKEFLDLIDDAGLEKMRSKTPEGRYTPLPDQDFSDISDGSRAASPSGSRDLKRYAMEALAALGLDEFVESVKIREKEKVAKTKKPVKKPAPKKREIVKKDLKSEEDEQINVEVETLEEGEILPSDIKPKPPKIDIISVEHSYSLPENAKVEPPAKKPAVDSWMLDHDYSGKKPPADAPVKSTTKERKKKSEKLVSHLLDNYLKKPQKAVKTYKPRDPLQEMMTCYEFLTKGVDQEDIRYFEKAFKVLKADETQSYWLRTMHWADHPVTDLSRPSKRSKGHQSGCARTQGFYKLDPVEKKKSKHHYGRNKLTESQAAAEAKTWTSAGREARSHQRRLLTAFGSDTDSDLLKFNQLKFRKKLLKFGKSEIHDWGLFAKEPIAADEMVIEYVGQKVRPFLADYREAKYQKRGIGSSYLFRIDLEHIVDATTCGNLARFINHSCNPNCYAKIITIEGEKKIVIYSKRDIKVDEEITYDYKFPLEEEKIPCLCGDPQCKGFLN